MVIRRGCTTTKSYQTGCVCKRMPRRRTTVSSRWKARHVSLSWYVLLQMEVRYPFQLLANPKNLCFRMQCGSNPPLPYTSHNSVWFNQDITIWWIRTVLWLHHLKIHGDKHYFLLLNNCSAHKVDEGRLPPSLHLVFLPPNVTNMHQPADMGMLASINVRYKSWTMVGLLDIFNAEDRNE